MRYYLDTNVLVMMLEKRYHEFNAEVNDILEDYGNSFYISSVAVHELIHLLQIKRIKCSKHEPLAPGQVLKWLSELGVTAMLVNNLHIQAYSEMPIVNDHTDPMDRLIIAQAITDRIPLISSDLRLPQYERLGLEHIYSKR